MTASFMLIASLLVATLAGAIYGQPEAASIGPPMSADPSLTASRVIGGVDTIVVDARLMTIKKIDAWPGDCDVQRSDFLSCVFEETRRHWPMQPTLHVPIWKTVDSALGAVRATALRLVCHSLKTVGQGVVFEITGSK
jgi:hypothetical protein